jgi:hypothetical protein
VTQSAPQDRVGGESRLPSFEPGVPNPARMWNYWLGGKGNFAADRELAGRVLQVPGRGSRRPRRDQPAGLRQRRSWRGPAGQ